MTNYIKDEIEALNLNLELAKKYEEKSASVRKIKKLMLEVRKAFKLDADKDYINSLYERIPLVYTSLFCEIRRCQN